ncbi:MAG TPA: hypothetical protein VJ692_05180 [Nitrospiraceae bacterium]|nr:hypothetical protein [Nitrospiraceae bacterium]
MPIRLNKEVSMRISAKNSVGKRRRKRLFMAPDIETPEVFTPNRKDWQRMEAAFGYTLDRTQRTAIIDLVDNYFFVHELERNAPFANDAIAWLGRLRAGLSLTLNAVLRKPNTPTLQREAELVGKTSLVASFSKYEAGAKWTWREIVAVIVHLERACNDVIVDFKTTNDGFREGSAWALLICELTQLATQDGLPSGAGKGDHASPFVRFVRELQKTFPPKYRKHLHSYEALAQAIIRARPRQDTNSRSKAK